MVAKKEGLKLRQSYRRTMPHLLWQTRYIKIASRRKEGIKAARMLKVRVGRILRDIERQMDDRLKEKYSEQLAIAFKILNQKKDDHNKIYSFHEPHVACIAKGKEHKKYEFGSKVSVLLTKNSGIIVGAMNFLGNPYDGKTLEPQLAQNKQIFGQEPKAVLVDEGYKGRQTIGETEVLRVHQKKKTGYSRWQWKQRFRRRSSIEPIIGHLKNDCRMARNYLKGTQGDSINLLLACAAFNFRKLMSQLAFYLQKLIMLIRFFIGPVIKSSPNFY
jgi:IS5 family transposase